MNPNVVSAILELVQLGVALVNSHNNGDLQPDEGVENTILSILQLGVQAYEQHTGDALEPSLIRVEPAL
jgi:hypothetical protein